MSKSNDPKSEVSSLADTAELELIPDLRAKYYVGVDAVAEIDFGAASHVGCVRANNEDHFAVVRRSRTREVLFTNVPRELLEPSIEEAFAYVVADGLGGAACGELASQLALTTAWEWGAKERSWPLRVDSTNAVEIEERMRTLVAIIAETMRRRGSQDESLRGMGTTFTAAYSVGRDVFIGHLGDSRAYLIRDRKIGQLTRDDTLAQVLLDAGAPPERVERMHHILTNCISTDDKPVGVTTLRVPLRSGDSLLLCTDGLTKHVTDAEIAAVVSSTEKASMATQKLLQLALDRGGDDNITLVLARYKITMR
jgi:serine/threonine protein phosphatase PrpC